MLYQNDTDVFTDEQTAILKQVESRLAATYSRQKISFLTGVSESALTRLLSGQPAAGYGSRDGRDTAEAIESLKDWLASETKGSSNDAGYAVTPTFSTLQNLYTQSHQWGLFIAITGAWGIGKTEAARYYAATHPRTYNQPGAVRIQFDEADRTPSAALAKIAQHLGVLGGAHSNGKLMGAIEGGIRPGDMLLLEECQLLGDAINVIASIYDATGVAIVAQGNPELSGMVWGKGAKFPRLASRTNRYDFPATTPEDVEAWLAWRGAGEGMDVTQRKGLLAAACGIACKPEQNGGLRALADVFRIIEKMYGKKVDAGILTTMASQLKPSMAMPSGKKRGPQ